MFSSNFTLGILGGGQLGKMLLYETRKWDIKTKVIDPTPEAPCAIACNEFIVGNLLDYNTVLAFGQGCDVLTFEIENVNVDALFALEKQGVKVYPSPASLQIIQNKASQKSFYKQHNIPTANFEIFQNINSLKDKILSGEIKTPFVWKSARFGYDGNGVKIVRSVNDLNNLPSGECIMEELVNFKNELAVILARNPSGQVATYPVVEMEFHPEANQVEYVICPARIPESVSQKAQQVAINVANAFQSIGLLAVEMFQTQSDEVIVNEVAPRPHNSGHYSIEASFTSQFEQHLRAILNLPLGCTDSKVGAVMVNLVGKEGYSGDVYYKNIEKILSLKGVTPHIYGKKQTRPFRKMGHITIVNEDLNQARQIAQQVKSTIEIISQTPQK